MFRLSIVLFLVLLSGSFCNGQEINFNRDIRPILSENCFFCHGQDPKKREAGLRLDIRKDAIESEAIVAGDAESSALIEHIFSDDPDEIMPPSDSNRSLTLDQKKLLRRWIDSGAKYSRHWAFVKPKRPTPPKSDDPWIRNPIDRFVLAKLKQKGLSPSREADRPTLIKRLSVDLTGLPPTPQEVKAFVEDRSPDAYEKLVDRLLASPRYGERMALPWLDAARYSDSNGFQQDGDTWQWIWRDWVVRALNEDLPFDKFTIWQLAGDLLPNATTDQKIASGFNRNHMLNGEGGAIAEEQRFVNLFDRMDTTTTNWLGLTMACAQCHDHKYDPITQRDYYQLMDAFNRVPESGTPQRQSIRIRVARPFLELPTAENKQHIAKLEAQIKTTQAKVNAFNNKAFANFQKQVNAKNSNKTRKTLPRKLQAILKKPVGKRTDVEKKSFAKKLRDHFNKAVLPKLKNKPSEFNTLKRLRDQLRQYRGDQIPRVMIMSDAKPRKTSILDRGEYLRPKQQVSFNTPAFLPPLPKGAERNRFGFAKWLVSAENPLTARVQVNRMWQHFFGIGIVRTSEDFGVQSEYPLHKDLLDWLAVEFRESGWSMKKMHRLIVTSATYRQSSRVDKKLLAIDRENRLYGRASRFRMPAMILRDWALKSSGLMNSKIGGAPVYPYQPKNVWEPLAITKERDFTYPASKGSDLYRRSLYTFWRRTVGPTNMFDASNRQTCRVRPSQTSTPLHALTTLNDPTWVETARTLAQSAMQKHTKLEDQLKYAWTHVLCRQLTQDEIARLKSAHQKQLAIYKADSGAAKKLLSVGASKRDPKIDPVQHAALTSICLLIYNLDEALTRE